MQEAKNYVDPATYLGIVIAQVQQFEFACNLKIGQAKFLFKPPHRLFHVNGDGNFEHPGLKQRSSSSNALTQDIYHRGELIL